MCLDVVVFDGQYKEVSFSPVKMFLLKPTPRGSGIFQLHKEASGRGRARGGKGGGAGETMLDHQRFLGGPLEGETPLSD